MTERDHRHEADLEVPERVWRVTMHYHDLIYIKAYWESIGQQMPEAFGAELKRNHDRMIAILEDENSQGGAYHTQRQEKVNATRKSEQSTVRAQSRAYSEGSQPRGSGPDRGGDRSQSPPAYVPRTRV